MTPFEIDILMHYYTRPTDHEVVERQPSIWPSTRDLFFGAGLLENGGDLTTYRLTGRGEAYVKSLLAVPLPVQHWVTPCACKVSDEH